jgi:hypothetical protein
MLSIIKDNIKLIVVALGFAIVAFLLLNRTMIEENFASSGFWHYGKLEDRRNFIEQKQEEVRDEQENFEPNKTTISDYSHFEISAEQKDMLEDPSMDLMTDIKELEDKNFLQPVTFFDQYAGVEEVEGNDAGSGDLSDMTSAFQNANQDRFYQNISMIESRGGNH